MKLAVVGSSLVGSALGAFQAGGYVNWTVKWATANAPPVSYGTAGAEAGLTSVGGGGKTKYLEYCKATAAKQSFDGSYSMSNPLAVSAADVVCSLNPPAKWVVSEDHVTFGATIQVDPVEYLGGLFSSEASLFATALTGSHSAATAATLGKAYKAVATDAEWATAKLDTTAAVPAAGYVSGKKFITFAFRGHLAAETNAGAWCSSTATGDEFGLDIGKRSEMWAIALGKFLAGAEAKIDEANILAQANIVKCASMCLTNTVEVPLAVCSVVVQADKYMYHATQTATIAEIETALKTLTAQTLGTKVKLASGLTEYDVNAFGTNDKALTLNGTPTAGTHSVLKFSRSGINGVAGTAAVTPGAGDFVAHTNGLTTAPTDADLTGTGGPFAAANLGGTKGTHALIGVKVKLTFASAYDKTACPSPVLDGAVAGAFTNYFDWTLLGAGGAGKATIGTACAATTCTFTVGLKHDAYAKRFETARLVDDITEGELLAGIAQGFTQSSTLADINNPTKAATCGAEALKITAVQKSAVTVLSKAAPATVAVASKIDDSLRIRGTATLKVADEAKAKAHTDTATMAKHGVLAFLKTKLPADASLDATFEEAQVTVTTSFGALPTTTTPKPAARRLAAKLMTVKFVVDVPKAKLKIIGADAKAQTTKLAELMKTFQEAQDKAGEVDAAGKSAFVGGLVLQGFRKAEAATDKAKAKTAFTDAYGPISPSSSNVDVVISYAGLKTKEPSSSSSTSFAGARGTLWTMLAAVSCMVLAWA